MALKAKQDDLRRLMRKRRENLKEEKVEIDSPFAKYNSLNQLFCIICNIQVKSSGLWASHVAGKVHRENALKKKKGTSDVPLKNITQLGEKRLEMQPPPAKQFKVAANESLAKSEPVKGSEKISLLNAYSSSSSEDENDESPIKPVENTPSTTSNVLPKDFFDPAHASSYSSINQEQPNINEKKPNIVTSSVGSLPEGFFDDPILDAKARNIEYKDPVEEEWERYQKAIAEETNVSKTIIEEDLEESTLERDITETDALIKLWEKSKDLQSLAEEASSKVPSKDGKGNSSTSTDDDLDEDDLLDWRSKGVKKR